MITAPAAELFAFDLAERDRPDDDVWWRVARGELSPDDAVAERRAHDGADEDGLRQRVELYAPPSEQESEQAVDDLVARFFTGSGESGSGESGPASGSAASDGESGSEEIVDLRAARRRRTRVILGSIMAVAAAAVLTWALVPRGGPPGESMPGFAPEWSNQYSGPMRSVEVSEGCQRYKSDGHLRVQLRPAIAVADDLVIAALGRPEAGEPRRLPIDPTLSAAGVITIDQSVEELGLTPGQWTLSFFVSRGTQLGEADLAELSPAEHPEVAVIQSIVCIE